MSWSKKYREYRKKVKELLFVRSELEYQEEILKDAHRDFEESYLRYCAENNIDVQKLKEQNEHKVDEIFVSTEIERNALIHKPVENLQEKTKVFNSIYKEVAKKLHPDKLSIFLPKEEIREKEGMFKTAASAMNNCDWGKLLDIADRLNIKPKTFDGIPEQIDIELEKINTLVNYNKNTYSWIWAKCENDECREKVILSFLQHLFGFVP